MAEDVMLPKSVSGAVTRSMRDTFARWVARGVQRRGSVVAPVVTLSSSQFSEQTREALVARYALVDSALRSASLPTRWLRTYTLQFWSGEAKAAAFFFPEQGLLRFFDSPGSALHLPHEAGHALDHYCAIRPQNRDGWSDAYVFATSQTGQADWNKKWRIPENPVGAWTTELREVQRHDLGQLAEGAARKDLSYLGQSALALLSSSEDGVQLEDLLSAAGFSEEEVAFFVDGGASRSPFGGLDGQRTRRLYEERFSRELALERLQAVVSTGLCLPRGTPIRIAMGSEEERRKYSNTCLYSRAVDRRSDYLLRPTEVFARFFDAWVRRNGDPDLAWGPEDQYGDPSPMTLEAFSADFPDVVREAIRISW